MTFQLSHLPANLMTSEDWRELDSAMSHDYAGWTLHELAMDLANREAQLWVITGAETRLLLVTQVVIYPKGRALHLRYLAGRGWFRKLDEINPLLDGLAAMFGCRFITGRFRGTHALRLYEKFGWNAVGIHVCKDLQDGQQRNNHNLQDRSRHRSERGLGEGSSTLH